MQGGEHPSLLCVTEGMIVAYKKKAEESSGQVVGPRDGMITVSVQMPGKDVESRQIYLPNVQSSLLQQNRTVGYVVSLMVGGLMAKIGRKIEVLS